MGGSLPGATGHMYARIGAPSNGKYAKHTLASAQDGKKVKYGTPEYEEAYNKGEVVTKEGVRSPILLDEVVVKGKKKDKNWLEQYADKIVDENKDAGVLGAILGTPISAVMSLPQLMGMKAFTGEMERPSEALDIENPYGAAAVDIVTDPANLIGAGVLTKEKALARLMASKEAGLLSRTHKLNPWAFKANPEMGYRMLGTEGYQDAINSGVLRAKPAPTNIDGGISLLRNTNRNPNTGKMQGALDRPYFADGFIDERYAADYMAAVNKAENNLVSISTHKGIAPAQAGNIPLENATLYKKDWLQGYKEVPKEGYSGVNNSIDHSAFDEYIRRTSLPSHTSEEAQNTLSNFKDRLKTPEGQRRAKELGVNVDYLNDAKILEDNTKYGYAQNNTIGLHKDLPNDVIKTVTRHEIEHIVKNAIQNQEMRNAAKWYNNLPFTNNSAKRLKILNTHTTPIDDVLSELELRRTPNDDKVIKIKNNTDAKDIDVSDYKDKLSNKQSATNYFDRGSNGNEKSAFAAEAQQYMLDKGIIKHPYENITPEKIKEAHVEAAFDKENPIRLFQIMKATDKNYNTVSKALNKMLTVTGAGAVGAAAVEQKREGGVIKDDMGQWAHPGEITEINSNDITMEGVPYDVLGISDTGDTKLMKPGKNYKFKGKKVTEYPMAQNGIKTFYNDYINSPKYKERLNLQEYDNPDKVILDRSKHLMKTKLNVIKDTGGFTPNNTGSYYTPSTNTVDYDEFDLRLYPGATPNDIKVHEFSHAVSALSPKNKGNLSLSKKEAKEINLRNKNKQEHEKNPEEAKADMDVLRYHLKKDNIYDTGKENFTPELYNIAKKKYKNNKTIKRFFDRFSDKDAVYLMNSVAQLDDNDSYPVVAKNGVNQQDEKGLQNLDQLTNFTNYNTKQPGGWLDTL
jgi:hypothetical protein